MTPNTANTLQPLSMDVVDELKQLPAHPVEEDVEILPESMAMEVDSTNKEDLMKAYPAGLSGKRLRKQLARLKAGVTGMMASHMLMNMTGYRPSHIYPIHIQQQAMQSAEEKRDRRRQRNLRNLALQYAPF